MIQEGKPNVRSLALDALLQIMEGDGYCDKILHQILEENQNLDKRDRAFLTRLVQGTVERCLEMDYIINRYSNTPTSGMKPVIREILRMSVYQLVYMDQVPDRAACNEAVRLTVARKRSPLKGFVNGVLRNVARQKEDIPYPSRKRNLTAHLSVWYSMPEWIVERFLEQYGEKETESILQSFLQEEGTTSIRCNVSLASVEQIRSSLEEEGVQVRPGRVFDYALQIKGYDRLNELTAFQKGWIQVQDESSMVVGQIAPVDKESVVIDLCAAPGGKSIHLADKMEAQGLIHACDITQAKLTLIRQSLIRMGIHNVKLKRNDALQLRQEWVETADLVVADLPCSGLGVIGKKPDIKYKTRPEDILSLARQQKKILTIASRYVRPGGYLLYSTCTIAPEENQEQVDWIKEELPFQMISMEEHLPQIFQGQTGAEGYLQILPSMTGGDGFFVSIFQKR